MVTTPILPGGPSVDKTPETTASAAVKDASGNAYTHSELAAASFAPSLIAHGFTETAQLPSITSKEMREKFTQAPIHIGPTTMKVEI